MHELTIAQNIVNIVQEEIARQNLLGKVKLIRFKAGKMNAIIPESLQFGFAATTKDSAAMRDAVLEIEEIPLKVRCGSCRREEIIDEPQFICSQCGSGDLEILSGKEMFVDNFEIE